jgi:hypothetical protein
VIQGGLEVRSTPYHWGKVLRDDRDGSHFGEGVQRQASEMRVGKDYRGREGTEDDVSELNTMRGDGITESKVVLAEEVGEIMEDDKQQAKNTPIEVAFGLSEIPIFQEGMEELEEGEQKFMECSPSLK